MCLPESMQQSFLFRSPLADFLESLKAQSPLRSSLTNGGVARIGALFKSPYNQDHRIVGSILGSWEPPHGTETWRSSVIL